MTGFERTAEELYLEIRFGWLEFFMTEELD